MRLLLIIVCIIGPFSNVQSQKNNRQIFPVIGSPMPEFTLKNVKYYSSKEISLKQFKGKWLIFEFWNKHCVACMVQFPKYDSIQKKFGDRIQIMLVGRQDKENEIIPLYNRLRKRLNLQLPCGFDSTFMNRLDIQASPFVIIIDSTGIVRGITKDITLNDISDFLSGSSPKLTTAFRMNELPSVKYDSRIPLLVDGNGGRSGDFLYRSLLSKFNPLTKIQSHPTSIENLEQGNRFEAMKVTASYLYKIAYLGNDHAGEKRDSLYGKIWPNIVLEIHDSSIFNSDLEHRLCYSLSVPVERATKKNMMEIMQRDLKNIFGYDVKLEARKMPVWIMVVTEKAKDELKTKGGPIKYSEATPFKEIYRNWPVTKFLYSPDDAPVFDSTGIVGNIDVTLDYETAGGLSAGNRSVRIRALQENGFQFIKREKEMIVLVVHDPK